MASARSYRFAWRPRWVMGHLIVLAAAVAMVLLGRWQLTVSERKHFSLQNFGYALQWWLFSLSAIGFWLKIMHDRAVGRAPAASHPRDAPVGGEGAVAYRRYVQPTRAEPDTDPTLAAYNAYLAALAEKDRR